MTTSLLDALQGPAGYSTALSLQADESDRVKRLIETQWQQQINRHAREHAAAFAELGIERYHKQAHLVNHSVLWPKASRILPRDAVEEIRSMSLFRQLTDAVGEFQISAEDGSLWEEIYWRIVRPHEPSDVGPLHADRWFWDLGHGTTPTGRERLKVWTAIVAEPGLSGLRVVPGSHLRDWRYHGETRDGTTKPQIDEDENELNPQLLPTGAGDAVVFHDRLLHGGVVGTGLLTRVSIEFTMFVQS